MLLGHVRPLCTRQTMRNVWVDVHLWCYWADEVSEGATRHAAAFACLIERLLAAKRTTVFLHREPTPTGFLMLFVLSSPGACLVCVFHVILRVPSMPAFVDVDALFPCHAPHGVGRWSHPRAIRHMVQ